VGALVLAMAAAADAGSERGVGDDAHANMAIKSITDGT
jgi:hypothetical protein